ncbi:MAG: PAS domain S-box protein [Candidatus Competibacterales bacterium]|nr:PAS domain S-box protein [Candidatus Competibacterales bacterium]
MAILVFVVAALVAATLIYLSERQRLQLERTRLAATTSQYAFSIQESIARALSATYPLAAMVRQSRGVIPDFRKVATEMLPYYPGVDSLQLAPDGVVQHIVPLAGNEQAIGHNLLADPARTKEAFRARDTGKLTLAGPFELMQGGLGAVGRLPVYLPDDQGQSRFWGFTSVLIRFPGVLETARLSRLETNGAAYELSRIHPDTGEKQVIARSETPLPADPVAQTVAVPNATWTLRAAPQSGWGNPAVLAVKLTLGLAMSLLLAYAAHLLARLKEHERNLLFRVAERTAELHATQQDLLRAQSIARIGSWSLAPDGYHVHCSQEAKRLLGLDGAETLNLKELFRQIHPDDRYLVDAAWQAAKEGTEYDIEHRLVTATGVRWVRERAELVFDADGILTYGVGTVQDISRSKTAEEALAQERNQLRTLLQTIPDLVWLKDTRGYYITCNQQFERFFGAKETAIIGRTDHDFVSAELADFFLKHDRMAIEAGKPRVNEEWITFADDGRRALLETIKTPLRDTAGRIIGVLGIGRDITQRKQAELALRESEQRFRDIVAASADWVWEVDAEARYTYASDSVKTLLGYTPEEIIGRTAFDLMPPDEADRVGRIFADIVSQGISFRDLENIVLDKRGRPHHTLTSGSPILNEQGEVHGYRGVDRDVTANKQAEAAMREALTVFNASNEAILSTDANEVIRSVNPAFTAITGYSAEEAIGKTPALLHSGRHDDAFYRTMWSELESTGAWEGEVWNRRKNGETYPEWLSISSVRDENGQVTGYIGLFSDITQRKQQEATVWRQANFDALTGLANRNLLYDRLERALVQARRNRSKVGLLLVDLDGFKVINDTLGHDIGDQLLVEVAQRIEHCVREQDTVARLGGDEFFIIVGDVPHAERLQVIGEKVIGVLRESFTLASALHYLSGSLGITVFPDDGEDVQTLMRYADIAMYSAKRSGKNRLRFYDAHMQVDAESRMRLEVELRAALKRHDFVLHFQPIVATDNGELVGAETLLRWQHPERGLISPAEFVPIAEDSGLIVELGGWVLREAAHHLQRWLSFGYSPLHLAVNVSSIQFREPGLPELVAEVMEQHGLAQGSLTLELTESILMDGRDVVDIPMQEIRKQGVGYSLDDFGTGFSSLSYLKRFPFDTVKIDSSFVRDCPEDRNDVHLVTAIIQMAHSLNLRVIAEGVETEAQLELLRELGCDYVQGFLISQPLPAAEFEALLKRHHPGAGRRCRLLQQGGGRIERTAQV